MMIGMFFRLQKNLSSMKKVMTFLLRRQMPYAIFIYFFLPSSAYDEKFIPIAKEYDLMSIRL
jgi:hypothetical protein